MSCLISSRIVTWHSLKFWKIETSQTENQLALVHNLSTFYFNHCDPKPESIISAKDCNSLDEQFLRLMHFSWP